MLFCLILLPLVSTDTRLSCKVNKVETELVTPYLKQPYLPLSLRIMVTPVILYKVYYYKSKLCKHHGYTSYILTRQHKEMATP